MIRPISTVGGRIIPRSGASQFSFAFFKLVVVSYSVLGFAFGLFAADLHGAPDTNDPAAADNSHRFNVEAYKVEGKTLLSADSLSPVFAKHTGTNITVEEIAAAASELQTEYRRQGYPDISVSVAPDRSDNGIVIMHVFQGAQPQILISGMRYTASDGEMVAATMPAAAGMTNTPPPATNAIPHIAVDAYEVIGNDLLSDDVVQGVLLKYTGTNVSFDDIGNMLKELTLEYRDRGYNTVSVTTPVQTITNAIIKIQVFEGTLATIRITGNHYYSSNNIMRALPGLKTNMILNSKLFQPELDRANANQDRQVYPQIGEGADPDTTSLTLMVKDRLPLHAKVELNNQNSPGTPELRVNSSAAYNNLWQLDHSLGVQYSFSPELYKQGSQWNFYDRPLVANYSAFYRLPLGNPASVADAVAANPGSFGYNEATRRFNLPPPSGVPELNVYASRSTIDTGVEILDTQVLYDVPGVRMVTRQDTQQDLTVNNGLGFRLSIPMPDVAAVISTVSAGLDYKTYDLSSFKTNTFSFVETTLNSMGFPNPPVISQVNSPVPATYTEVRYLPVTIRWDGSRRDADGIWTSSLNYSFNYFTKYFPNSSSEFQKAAGSSYANGSYGILSAALAREQILPGDWRFSLRADGQWANQPLISNEQFGAGGIASVRGYHEGEVFGDTGWHISGEQKTPPLVVGLVNGSMPLTIRGSVYMDYANTFLLDPQGRPGHTPLWGTGFGVAGSIGNNWEARFLFSMPLLDAGTIEAHQPFFDFSISAQF
jgi:hemolysin activation/secretion protein